VLFIRWISAEVRVVAYFTNFVLVACFFGLGLGYLRAGRPGTLARSVPALLATLLLTAYLSRARVVTGSENLVFLNYEEGGPVLPLWLALTAVYAATTLVFVPIGQELGRLFELFPPLHAYSLNILGSVLGAALMPILAFLGAPPWLWIALGALGLLHALAAARARIVAAAALLSAAVALVLLESGAALWSPYQKLEIQPLRVHPTRGPVFPWMSDQDGAVPLPREVGFSILVNDDFYQSPVDLSARAVADHPGLAVMREQYEIPYRFGPLDDVLVVGAGTGNDVAAALRLGARHVDAVEIDPVLVRLGRERHPERPYQDPRVSVFVDDARSFFKRAPRSYDVIVFALLDSHRLSARMANIRLDSYVYTVESFREAARLLEPDGLVVVMHALGQPWMVRRLFSSLETAFDQLPYYYTAFHPHMVGMTMVVGPGLSRLKAPRVRFAEGADVPLPTDDWPFFYLRHRRVPSEYLWVLFLVFGLSAATLVAGRELRGLDWPYFLLGAAFMLLETRSITATALLFGSTWVVTSLIVIGVLATILLANWTALRLGTPSLPTIVAMLAALLLANLWVPLDAFPNGAAAVAWVCSPLYAAGLLFARQFARTGDRARALGSNLLGGVAGGFVEYASMAFGCTALLWGALGLYLLAFAAWRRQS
jgi:SAM-dependent methyltransferase